MSFNMSFRVPFVMPFDDIPPEHVLGILLRYPPLMSELRKELEKAKREAESEEVTERMLEENTMEQIISNRMQYNFKMIVGDYSIHYMQKSNTNARRNDDIFYVYPINGGWNMGDSALVKIRIFGGLLGRSPIKLNEVQFKVPDLRGEQFFTVGPSRRKQHLNFNRGLAATMAAIRPVTARVGDQSVGASRVGLERPINPYIAAAYIAPMLGASMNADAEDERMRREAAAAAAATVASLPEPKSHWSNNVNLSSIKLRKSRKRTRKVRTRRH
jgi:hypothetical protein